MWKLHSILAVPSTSASTTAGMKTSTLLAAAARQSREAVRGGKHSEAPTRLSQQGSKAGLMPASPTRHHILARWVCQPCSSCLAASCIHSQLLGSGHQACSQKRTRHT